LEMFDVDEVRVEIVYHHQVGIPDDEVTVKRPVWSILGFPVTACTSTKMACVRVMMGSG
jgi:hypothetical protein